MVQPLQNPGYEIKSGSKETADGNVGSAQHLLALTLD